MKRLMIIANRLPVTVRVEGNASRLEPSSGGLATALRSLHQRTAGIWVGWSGITSKASARAGEGLSTELMDQRLVAVELSQYDLSHFYNGFSNGVIWPLFHFLLDKVNLDAELDWQSYRVVNHRFAKAAARQYQRGDVIWVHDYQLMLVPGMLRKLLPRARIGFFLHVPFPGSDVFRILPWRTEVLESLLAADLVGFHTSTYQHNFLRSAAQLTNADCELDQIRFNDRVIRVGVYPIGVDVTPFEHAAADPAVQQEVERIRRAHPDKRILLGVDRLDYTKGLPRRLLTIGRLLERHPELRDRLLLIQVAIPSRQEVAAYDEIRRVVNELSGRVNAQFGSPIGSPIQLLYRTVPFTQLVALYRVADAMLVTPLRDGMNLVAKEYVASRTDDDGVLVLSEFAGAAAELQEAIAVNPYDLTGTAAAIAGALKMDPDERRIRMQAMRAHVRTHDVHRWATRFIDDLVQLGNEHGGSISLPPVDLPEEVRERLRKAPLRHILLDYDGTLVPYFPLPALALPDRELSDLLLRLSKTPSNLVHVVTGRTRVSIEPWLGHLPIALHAEHGYWSRMPGGHWVKNGVFDNSWIEAVRNLVIQFVERTPGAILEEKEASLALHYRNADPSVAGERLRWLREELRGRATDDLEISDGPKSFEIRRRGIHKGLVGNALAANLDPTTEILAIGDDRTDEDLFSSLPASAVTVKVGGGNSRAKYALDDVGQVRSLLEDLCND
ncbi:MAG: bifunctional alpha,alpha-trehalose-phosphate synthase (UDP-forming)/trehalose-phosphatase [Myxococcales bacterium]